MCVRVCVRIRDCVHCLYAALLTKSRRTLFCPGYFDVDHTLRKGAKRDRESRSRSRERDKVLVKSPDKSRGKGPGPKKVPHKTAQSKTTTQTKTKGMQATPSPLSINAITEQSAVGIHFSADAIGCCVFDDSCHAKFCPLMVLKMKEPVWNLIVNIFLRRTT